MPKFSLRALLLLFFGFGIVLAFVCQVIFPSPDGSPYRSWRRLTFVYLEQLPRFSTTSTMKTQLGIQNRTPSFTTELSLFRRTNSAAIAE